MSADIERQEHLLRRPERDHDVAVARVSNERAPVHGSDEAILERRVRRAEQRVLEPPHEIRLVVEVDLVAQRERTTEAVAARGEREAIAGVEAEREAAAAA